MRKYSWFVWLTVTALVLSLVPLNAVALPVRETANEAGPATAPAELAAPAEPAAPSAASNWCVAGSFQPGSGWSNGTDPMYDDGTHGDLIANDGVLTLDYAVAKAPGYYE